MGRPTEGQAAAWVDAILADLNAHPNIPRGVVKSMTESEWLKSEDPLRMLEWIRLGNVAADDDYPPNYPHCPVKVSDRKLRLFYLAVWDASDWVSDAALREASYREGIRYVNGEAEQPSGSTWILYSMDPHAIAAVAAMPELTGTPGKRKAEWLRDLIGNPFGPVRDPRVCHAKFPDILSITQAAYDERDFAALPILADALTDAGCDNMEVLLHLRNLKKCGNPHCWGNGMTDVAGGFPVPCWCHETPGYERVPGEHVRGCWALDCILGKS